MAGHRFFMPILNKGYRPKQHLYSLFRIYFVIINLRYLSIFLLINIMVACQKDQETPVFEYRIDMSYRPYMNAFIQEAAHRGIQIDTSNLILEGVETLADTTCGVCNHTSRSNQFQKVIQINNGYKCFETSVERETVVFHELGHCLLGRSHDNSLLPNGDPKSIMKSDSRKMYAPCTYQFGNQEDCNNTYKRAYYLDELFDPSTPVPDWAK